MAKSKSYTLMLLFEEGGTVKPLPWSKDHLQPDSIIFVINEDTQTVYQWIGKRNSLVRRRTALRYSDSLKGHGYQVGKSLIGRGVTKMVEIDEKKVGGDPETSKNNDKFIALFDQPFVNAMEEVVVLGESGEGEEIAAPAPRPATKPAPKPAAKPAAKAAPKPAAKPAVKPTSKPTPKPVSRPTPPVEEGGEEYPSESDNGGEEEIVESPRLAAPKLKAPVVEAVEDGPADKGTLKLGLVILSVVSQVPDVYVSRKRDGSYEIESMDGVLCSFKQDGDDIVFTADSFERLDGAKKKTVKDWYLSKTQEL
jgi:hypothetical protein